MKLLFYASRVLSTGVLALISLNAAAQQVPKVFGKAIRPEKLNTENTLIRCASTEYEEYLQEKFPERANTAQFEQWISPKVEEVKAKRLSARNANMVVTIPVVVHVIHNGDAVGTDENIADAQVLSQITVLNQDYRKMINTNGYNTNPVGADMEIQFELAAIDPDGQPTNGIDRVNLNRASWSEYQVESSLKPSTQWNPNKYFNIWVCNFGGDLSDVLGYAQFPSASGLSGLNSSEGSANTDGVIIGYQYFGSKQIYPQGDYAADYNLGRTTTHEIGHCFGLLHVDGDNSSCSVNAADSFKDYCPDTPAVSTLHFSCSPANTCPSAAGVDMIENYMDYTPDACMNIFTQNQKGRMLAVLENSPRRASLLTSNVLGTKQTAFTGISLYPNPVQDVLTITMPQNNTPDNYTVYNVAGQVIAKSAVSSGNSLIINTAAYNSGIYFITMTKGSQSQTFKFIKS